MTRPFSRLDHAERLEKLPGKAPKIIERSNSCILALENRQLWLSCNGSPAAGAIGAKQGNDLCRALQRALALTDRFDAMTIIIDSAGAHLQEPMEGLKAVNNILETLWEIRRTGKRIRAIIPNRCYGGASVFICTVADEIILGPKARLGLIGSRVTGASGVVPSDAAMNAHPKLRRAAGSSAQDYLNCVLPE